MRASLRSPNTAPVVVIESEYGECKITLTELPATRFLLVTVETTAGSVAVDSTASPIEGKRLYEH